MTSGHTRVFADTNVQCFSVAKSIKDPNFRKRAHAHTYQEHPFVVTILGYHSSTGTGPGFSLAPTHAFDRPCHLGVAPPVPAVPAGAAPWAARLHGRPRTGAAALGGLLRSTPPAWNKQTKNNLRHNEEENTRFRSTGSNLKDRYHISVYWSFISLRINLHEIPSACRMAFEVHAAPRVKHQLPAWACTLQHMFPGDSRCPKTTLSRLPQNRPDLEDPGGNIHGFGVASWPSVLHITQQQGTPRGPVSGWQMDRSPAPRSSKTVIWRSSKTGLRITKTESDRH